MKPGSIHLWMVVFLLSIASGMAGAPAAWEEIPDQRVLLHYSNGVETLVMDTTFKGAENNFAWIIPVPSRPEVQMATTGLFPTLEIQFYPEVVFKMFPYWILIAIFGGYLVLVINTYRRFGFGRALVIGILLLVLIGYTLLPSLATSKHRWICAGVSVVNRQTVGGYQTEVLASPDGSDLLAWLAKNSLTASTNMLPIMHAYAAEGWCFVASKVSRTTSSGPVTPQPLILKFKTDRPVLPLRLTGSTEDSWTVHLYAFGPERAELLHFKTEICALPTYPLNSNRKSIIRNDLVIRHPLLKQLVEDTPIATRLTGHLNGAQMQEDSYISWKPFRAKQQTVYGNEAANILAFNVMVGLAFGIWLLWELSFGFKYPIVGKIRQKFSVIGVVCIFSWIFFVLSLPRCKMVVSYDRFRGMDQQYERRLYELAQYPTNTYTCQPLLEQDSPGNWTTQTNGLTKKLLWYDWDGAPHPAPWSFDDFPMAPP